MKIDWSGGFWMVWDIKTGNRLAKVRQIHVRVPSQLLNEQDSAQPGGWHGWLIVSGQLRIDGETAFIE